MEPKDWYLKMGGLTTGPIPGDELRDWIRRRWLASDSLLFDPKQKKWVPLASFSSFADLLPKRDEADRVLQMVIERYVETPVKRAISWREKKRELQINKQIDELETPKNDGRDFAWPGLRPSLALFLQPDSPPAPPAAAEKNPEALEKMPVRPMELDGAAARAGASASEPAKDPAFVALVDDLLSFEAKKVAKLALRSPDPEKPKKRAPMEEIASRPETAAAPSAIPTAPQAFLDQPKIFAELQRELAAKENYYWERSARGMSYGVSWPTVIAVTVAVSGAVYGKPLFQLVAHRFAPAASTSVEVKKESAVPVAHKDDSDSAIEVPSPTETEDTTTVGANGPDQVIRDGQIIQHSSANQPSGSAIRRASPLHPSLVATPQVNAGRESTLRLREPSRPKRE